MDTELITELHPGEAQNINGGTIAQYAVFLAACFGAGFEFGYHEVGPAILEWLTGD
jgi:hypothetical protein